jgi:hypothetical protein
MRRSSRRGEEPHSAIVGDLHIDLASRQVISATARQLSRTEFNLLVSWRYEPRLTWPVARASPGRRIPEDGILRHDLAAAPAHEPDARTPQYILSEPGVGTAAD